MRTCDLCGTLMDLEAKQTPVCIGYKNGAWQHYNIDMCGTCSMQLDKELKMAEANFYYNKRMGLKYGHATKTN